MHKYAKYCDFIIFIFLIKSNPFDSHHFQGIQCILQKVTKEINMRPKGSLLYPFDCDRQIYRPSAFSRCRSLNKLRSQRVDRQMEM